LVSRFEWGLTTDLQPPDVETRTAILRKKEERLGIQLPDEVIDFLAQRIRSNVRRLEGALIRVASYLSLTGRPLGLDTVESLLREVLHEEGRHTITIDTIQKRKDELKARASFSLGQNIFTPEDTAATQLIPEDRPYAGWLYMGFGMVANQGTKRYDKLELEIGVVGPYAFAEDVQTFWHSLLGLQVPQDGITSGERTRCCALL